MREWSITSQAHPGKPQLLQNNRHGVIRSLPYRRFAIGKTFASSARAWIDPTLCRFKPAIQQSETLRYEEGASWGGTVEMRPVVSKHSHRR